MIAGGKSFWIFLSQLLKEEGAGALASEHFEVVDPVLVAFLGLKS